MKNDSPKLGLYVHIPFCLKKCAYCDFYSQTDYALTDLYLTALLKEAELLAARYAACSVDTVYIGGGTPSSLTTAQLARLLEALASLFSIEKGAEFTLEANPATLDREKLAVLKQGGVNRLSIGLQSASDSELRTLSRSHTFEAFYRTYSLSRAFFDNISLDLMFGLPDQTRESFSQTLDTAVKLAPEHLSVYALKIEEGTPFAQKADSLALPDEDAVSDMYLYACAFLEKNGYRQYEISNFAKQGCCSRHNLRYWKREAYFGLGPGAHSFVENRRYANLRDIHRYCEALLDKEEPPLAEETVLCDTDVLEEEIMLSLRLTEGLDLSHLRKKTGYAMEKAARDKLIFYQKNGFLKRVGDRIAFTPKGFLVSNTILSELLP